MMMKILMDKADNFSMALKKWASVFKVKTSTGFIRWRTNQSFLLKL